MGVWGEADARALSFGTSSETSGRSGETERRVWVCMGVIWMVLAKNALWPYQRWTIQVGKRNGPQDALKVALAGKGDALNTSQPIRPGILQVILLMIRREINGRNAH